MLTSAPPCISYYKQNKLYRLVYDDSRQLEWAGTIKAALPNNIVMYIDHIGLRYQLLLCDHALTAKAGI